MELNTFVTEYGDKQTHHFTVTETVYKGFQLSSGDMNPLHTDESFALEKGFLGRVMYGNILNGFISFFIGECLPTKEVIIHTQDIKYKSPVYLNDALLFEARLEGFYESVKAVEFKYKFYNNSEKIVASGHIQIGLL